MKKINLLIPTVLAATVAPITACAQPAEPTVTEFELTKQYAVKYETGFYGVGLRSEQRLDFDKGTTYTVFIDMKNFPTPNKSDNDMVFFVGTDVSTITASTAMISTAKVKVGSVPLTRVYTRDDLGSMKYFIDYYEGKTAVVIGPSTLESTSKVEIAFEIRQSVKQYYLVSQATLIIISKSI